MVDGHRRGDGGPNGGMAVTAAEAGPDSCVAATGTALQSPEWEQMLGQQVRRSLAEAKQGQQLWRPQGSGEAEPADLETSG